MISKRRAGTACLAAGLLGWAAWAGAQEPVSLSQSGSRGTFNMGPAQGRATTVADPARGQVLKFDFTVPAGATAGLWTKDYPAAMGRSLTLVTVAARAQDPVPAVVVTLEIKGSLSVKKVPVAVKGGWEPATSSLDWERIGDLREVVLVVSPASSEGAAGSLLVDVRFEPGTAAPASGRRIGLMDAANRGTFTMGAAQGKLSVQRDAELAREVLRLDFSAPRGGTAGVWSKDYPGGTPAVNGVRTAVRLENPDLISRAAVSLEIKGTRETQRIPLSLGKGWSVARHLIDWARVGELREIVFVVSARGTEGASGAAYLDLEFLDLPKQAPSGAFTWRDAADKGVFNIGAAEGALAVAYDDTAAGEVLRFDYTASPGTSAGVWTKGYPAGLGPESVNGVRLRVRADSAGQAAAVAVALELKGPKEIQRIPIGLKASWTTTRELIDWPRLGQVREAVLVVSPLPSAGKARGSIYMDLSFLRGLPGPKPRAAGQPIGLMEAREQGTFNIGPARGAVTKARDSERGKDVLRFDYSAPAGSVIGVWTKGYPGDLSPGAANGVRVAARSVDGRPQEEVTLALELKGPKETQSLPISVGSGWTGSEERVDWARIGELKEAVFVVTPKADVGRAKGALHLDLEFIRLASPARASGASGYSLQDARERGTFNIQAAEGTLSLAYDAERARDVVRMEYSAAPGSVVGIWTKGYPEGLSPESVNAVRVGIRAGGAEEAGKLIVSLELKGEREVQQVPLAVQGDWVSAQEWIDWTKIGALREAVLVVTPKGRDKVSGRVSWDLEFIKAEKPKGGLTPARKVLLAALAGLLLAFGMAFLRKGWARFRGQAASEPFFWPKAPIAGFGRDALYGTVTALILSGSLTIYVLGILKPAETGFWFLGVGFLSATIAGLLHRLLVGRHLLGREILQHFLFAGLLAATSSKQALWQAPGSWPQLLLKSNLTAALAFLVFQAANARSIALHGRHLRARVGALIIGTPYVFGWLLLLSNGPLLQRAAEVFTGNLLTAWPLAAEIFGRMVVVFAVNEIIANAVGYVAKGQLLRTTRAHLLTLGVSLAVVVGPEIADLGSGPWAAGLPGALRAVVGILAAMFSQGGLWMEVYFVTGLVLDGLYGYAPTGDALARHARTGFNKGLAFSALFLGLLYGLAGLLAVPGATGLIAAAPLAVGLAAGALFFPLGKTIIETFDGSMSFFARARYSYGVPGLYARGAVAGLGLSYGLSSGFSAWTTGDRMAFGLLVGLAASAGVSLLRDAFNSPRRRGRIQSWRVYAVDACLGGFVGTMLAFYMDATQVPAVIEKFKLYTSAGFEPRDYTIYSLVSKWGKVALGKFSGGARLFFDEALAGVITWSIAAWLFAINRVFLEAYFARDKHPIKHFFSKAGFVELTVNMIHVMRWGLWMSPIINTGLRMMGQATWYNQDGAVRTLIAIFKSLIESPADFQAWSLAVFVALLAFDAVRILIWIDHMGLRVATLVNLSFIGMDRLDERLARFIGPAAAQRYIPEAVKRFTTWAPLLIPFYIPRGADWEYAWTRSQEIQQASGGGLAGWLTGLTWGQGAALFGAAALLAALASAGLRALRRRSVGARRVEWELSNREYRVVLGQDGGGYSHVLRNGYDVTRRSYDPLHPAGRALFLVEEGARGSGRPRPVLGNFPRTRFPETRFSRQGDSLCATQEAEGLKTRLEIRLPDRDATVERWTVTVENTTRTPRRVKVVPYVEWVLDNPDGDRGHTQYNRLFPELEYAPDLNTLVARQRKTKTVGFLAAKEPPEGFLTSRMDFIGRARSLWSPRALETLRFSEPRPAPPCPSFDPIGSLLAAGEIPAGGSKTFTFLLGFAKDPEAARAAVKTHLAPQGAEGAATEKPGRAQAAGSKRRQKKAPLIGHGEIPPGTPQPYARYEEDGRRLLVRTPYTPRPYDHALSNAAGHYVLVTNRGLHTTSNGNSQQNPVTADWADTVTREVPSEAIYLYDPERAEWYSPAHHPLNDPAAACEADFGVDGTAVFRMSRGAISTELTVFVPPRDTLGVYLLTIKNAGDEVRRLRVSPYFQIALTGLSERRQSALVVRRDPALEALFFENPRNSFRYGPAFAAMTAPAEIMETSRARYLGEGRGVDRPALVETGRPAPVSVPEDRTVAAFLTTVEIPAHGERTLAVVLGQADSHKDASALIKKYKSVEAARAALEETRNWWLALMETVRVRTSSPDFDHYLHWLKYQAVAERLWARRGFYQTSGAYGFRDQLQDSVNLMWVDPALARKQILLHASQQFIEGDVVHWFHTLHDGRTAFSNRSHASDNLLWLPWAVGEYVRATGDRTLLEEQTSYLRAETPFLPLPKNKHGWGTIYQRSAREDTVYRHCMKAIDLVLDKRMGAHGLPLIGTGDWNDGLDEIGSEGRGESVWLGFFLFYILKNMADLIGKKEGAARRELYVSRMRALEIALENTWREDRYLRAIHDDGTEIGVKDSGVWEIDALTAAWAVMSGINPERGRRVFATALKVLEKDNVILLGWPALREDTKPYLGRSSHYPEGVRENGMYCHGVQWLVRAARLLAEECDRRGDRTGAADYREDAARLWMKITPLTHVVPDEIEVYGGQPNKQAADMLSTFDQGRMIWHGYTGAAGWLLRQAFEGVVGAALVDNQVVLPPDLQEPRGDLNVVEVERDLSRSPFR